MNRFIIPAEEHGPCENHLGFDLTLRVSCSVSIGFACVANDAGIEFTPFSNDPSFGDDRASSFSEPRPV